MKYLCFEAIGHFTIASIVLFLCTTAGLTAQTDFFELVKTGTPAQVQAAIAAGEKVNDRDTDRMTPLMYAVTLDRDAEIITALLKAGANVDDQNQNGRTPLILAAINSTSFRVFPQLLLAGANTTLKDNDGKIAFDYLVKNNSLIGTYTALVPQGKSGYQLLSPHTKDVNGDEIGEGWVANVVAPSKQTLSWGHFYVLVTHDTPQNILAAFVAGEAWVNTPDSEWKRTMQTPLIMAAYHRSPEVISLLLMAGAKVQASDKDGRTPLMTAASTNWNPRVISLLLMAGAKVDERDNSGLTPLIYAAAFNGNPVILNTLLQAGAKVDDLDTSGNSALVYAARQTKNPAIVTTLLRAGANRQLKSKEQKTAFDYAKANPSLTGTEAYELLNYSYDSVGTLVLTSIPPGALIRINGVSRGQTTPCRLLIGCDKGRLRNVKVSTQFPGYYPTSLEVTVTAGVDTPCASTLEPLPVIPAGTKLGDKRTNLVDGAEMVWVPAGEFLMGSTTRSSDEQLHTVYLDGYWIYKTEVTLAQYRKFCQATGRAMPMEQSWKWQLTHPIVDVSWDDATAYAEWAGAALPTEAQWEKAARGTDGREYPWGNAWDASKAQCSKSIFSDAKKPAPVGSFPTGASPYGCLDMAGNVAEWCADWYGTGYYKTAPAKNPLGPAFGVARVLRGGSWRDANVIWDYFRVANRNSDTPAHRADHIGFRCVLRSPGP